MKVYIIVGMPGAGKEEFVTVCQDLGMEIIRMGDVVRDEAEARGIPNDGGIGKFAHSERQAHGYDIWARRTVPLVKEELTIIDGCRGTAEVDVFREGFGESVKIVAIHASPQTRFQRLKRRNRGDAPDDLEEFRERDQRELGWGLGNVIARANFMIVNEGTLDRFKAEAEEVLRELDE